jgi:hypothetical protein
MNAGPRNRTELSEEFLPGAPPSGRTMSVDQMLGRESAGRTSAEIAREHSGGRTANEAFAHGSAGAPEQVAHFGAGTIAGTGAGRNCDPAQLIEEMLGQAERQEFTPFAQVVQVWLGPVNAARLPFEAWRKSDDMSAHPNDRVRDIDFQKQGPMIGLNRVGQLIIPNTFLSLPQRRDRDRAGRLRMLAPTIRQYVTAQYNSLWVIQPLLEILVQTLGAGSRRAYMYFQPDETRWPILFYDPHSGSMQVWGGGGYRF